MSRKIDGSSDETAKKSVEKLATELAPADLQKFTEAYGKLAMRWAFATAFAPGENKDSKAFLNQINGKTPQEIIQLAASLDSESASNPTVAASPKEQLQARLNIPFNIDGVEILITGFHTGKLQRIERQFSFGSVPDRPFLLADVALKNTTEGTIIHIQDVWEHATVTDNFGNVYEGPHSLSLDRSEVRGLVSSQALKPGEAVTDMMVFEVPLENAQKFTLSCDPNFYRPAGNQRLNQLSDKSFKLEFARSDIK